MLAQLLVKSAMPAGIGDEMALSRKTLSKTLESDITRRIRQYLDLIGVFHWKQWQGPMSQPRGVSDILGCCKGKLLAIEVKKPGGKLSEYQEKFLNSVNAAGGVGFMACSVDEVDAELKARFLL